LWIGADSEIMLSWTNLKCYLDWKGCGSEHSWQIWNTLWNRTDDRGWCHDLIRGDMWIKSNDIGSCLDKIFIAMCIGKCETSSFHVHFEVPCGLERMILDDVLTSFEVPFGLEGMWINAVMS
jgi:hypothetical protein